MTTDRTLRTTARVFDSIDALKAAEGTHLGKSEWRAVTQNHVDTFADLTLDHQWIHVDVQRAKRSAFGGTLGHGFLTLGLVPTLAEEVYRYEGFAMSLNYGASKLRFPAPLPSGHEYGDRSNSLLCRRSRSATSSRWIRPSKSRGPRNRPASWSGSSF